MSDHSEHSTLEKTWVNARRNNRFYIANKTVSVLLASFLAAWTLSYKADIWTYTYVVSPSRHYTAEGALIFMNADGTQVDPALVGTPIGKIDYNYTFIYWLLFLFYSF